MATANGDWAGALSYWIWEETDVLKFVASNPSTTFWMYNFYIFIVKMKCWFKKTKINGKEAGLDHFKKTQNGDPWLWEEIRGSPFVT